MCVVLGLFILLRRKKGATTHKLCLCGNNLLLLYSLVLYLVFSHFIVHFSTFLLSTNDAGTTGQTTTGQNAPLKGKRERKMPEQGSPLETKYRIRFRVESLTFEGLRARGTFIRQQPTNKNNHYPPYPYHYYRHRYHHNSHQQQQHNRNNYAASHSSDYYYYSNDYDYDYGNNTDNSSHDFNQEDNNDGDVIGSNNHYRYTRKESGKVGKDNEHGKREQLKMEPNTNAENHRRQHFIKSLAANLTENRHDTRFRHQEATNYSSVNLVKGPLKYKRYVRNALGNENHSSESVERKERRIISHDINDAVFKQKPQPRDSFSMAEQSQYRTENELDEGRGEEEEQVQFLKEPCNNDNKWYGQSESQLQDEGIVGTKSETLWLINEHCNQSDPEGRDRDRIVFR